MRSLLSLSVMSLLLAAATTGHGLLSAAIAAEQRKASSAPEVFTCQAQARTGAAGAATHFKIHVDRYTPEYDRKVVTDAMTHGGYPAFVNALREAPVVGRLELGGQTFALRFAREQPAERGRSITLVTERPVYFVGGGQVDAKPREGFSVAVVQLTVDEVGMGAGTMAAAARVKPDGKGSVLIEDYAEEPIKLESVRREIK